MILVLTGDDDVHADAVEVHLRRLGSPVLRFDPARYPADADLTVGLRAHGQVSAVLRYRQSDIDLGSVDAVWVRRPNRPCAPAAYADTVIGAEIESEAAGLLADVWELLDVPFVPARPLALLRASLKVRQLSVAGRLGFEVPGTLVTNDPDAFLDHYEGSPGGVITKRVVSSQRLVTVDGDETSRSTLAVRPRDLVDVDAVRLAPILLQAMVDKAFEVRATVVGDEVFAAAIHSQETHHTRIDFRRYDPAHTRITPYLLPPEVATRCVALVGALGLRYGAIDLIITPEGRTVFLEINPNGQYLWIESATGLPISRALAALLVGTGRR